VGGVEKALDNSVKGEEDERKAIAALAKLPRLEDILNRPEVEMV